MLLGSWLVPVLLGPEIVGTWVEPNRRLEQLDVGLFEDIGAETVYFFELIESC